MKRFIILLAILTGSLAVAQPQKRSGEHPRQHQNAMQDFTPEQIAQLQTKQLTLALDLTASQQASIKEVNLKLAQERKAKSTKKEGQTLSSEQRYNQMLAHLDKQIEVKASFKAILNAQQFEKWQKLHRYKGQKRRNSRRGKRR